MSLDLNTGYSNVFKIFVDFAQKRVDANDATAIADAHVQKPLVGRKTLAITQSLTDEVHKWTRGMDEWTVNDRTRALFVVCGLGVLCAKDRHADEVGLVGGVDRALLERSPAPMRTSPVRAIAEPLPALTRSSANSTNLLNW
jgi:hypothetical protein